MSEQRFTAIRRWQTLLAMLLALCASVGGWMYIEVVRDLSVIRTIQAKRGEDIAALQASIHAMQLRDDLAMADYQLLQKSILEFCRAGPPAAR